MSHTRTYDLSIRNVGKGKIPELVFKPTSSAHAEAWRLIKEELLGEAARQLSLLPELLVYGPHNCGRYEVGEESCFVVRLIPAADPQGLAHTIQTTLSALSATGQLSSNRVALADLELTCDPKRDQHGYSVSGYMHEAFLKWLGAYEEVSEQVSSSLVADVVSAMRAAWNATAPEDQREFASECTFHILDDGRFSFNCFGNACDMSLYPDQLGGFESIDEHIFISFGCHNVDWPWQQITFIAGFAVLLETVRKYVDDA